MDKKLNPLDWEIDLLWDTVSDIIRKLNPLTWRLELVYKADSYIQKINPFIWDFDIVWGTGASYIIKEVTWNWYINLTNAVANHLLQLKAYGWIEQRNLPTEYTQLEYITFDWQSFIDTGYTVSLNDEIQTKLKFTVNWFIYWASTSVPRITLYWSPWWNQRWWDKYVSTNWVPAANTDLVVKHNKDTLIVNNTTMAYDSQEDFTTTETLTIWNDNWNTTTNLFSWDLYYFKFFKNWVLARDYVPAKNSNNVVWLFDMVSWTFFDNDWTWTLTAWPNAVPTPTIPIDIVCNNWVLKIRHQSWLPWDYTKIEYIEGDGNQYIDTGYFFDNIATETLTLDFMRTAESTGSMLYGTRTAYKNNGYAMQFTNAGATYIQWWDKDTGLGSTSAWALNTRYTAIRTGAYYSFNGANYTVTDTTTPTQNYPLYLFCVNNGGTAWTASATRIYSVVITDSNNVVKFNAIPCKNSSNVIGLYDTVSGTFLENKGTGDFVAGDPVSDPVEIYIDWTTETIEDELWNTSTAEMLLKVWDYADEQEILSWNITRKIGIKVFDGTENWTSSAAASNLFYSSSAITNADTSNSYSPISTHFNGVLGSTGYAAMQLGDFKHGSGNSTFYFKIPNVTTAAECIQWLTDQYNAWTPVIVVYPLATPTTETVTGQTMNIPSWSSTIEITQASIDNLWLYAKYKATA